MTVLFRCRLCGGRHFGQCPMLTFYLQMIKEVAKVAIAAVEAPQVDAKNGAES